MKSIHFFAAAAISIMAHIADAIDLSQSVPVERYTIVDANTIRQDEGVLKPNGIYKAITSFNSGLLGIPLSQYEPISGRPVMIDFEFNTWKQGGVIPRWVRSQASFPFGDYNMVIVSVTGGPDPNPIPVIYDQPSNQAVLLGDLAFFSIDAGPADYLTYQWLLNGKKIPGQNSSYILIDVEKATQAGSYSVALTTGGKSVTSKKAALKIVVPVTITTSPKSQTTKTGHGAVFRVAAKGTGPYAYQWYFNGNPIPKATKSFYSISHVGEDDAGGYFVVVSNQLSFSASMEAMLSVNP